jgi:hypothetical protein
VARAGDEIVNPVTGHRIAFRKTTRDTDGELLQLDWIGAPSAPRPRGLRLPPKDIARARRAPPRGTRTRGP